MRFEIVNCVDPSFRSSSSKQKAKGVNLVSVFLRHNFLLPSNFLTLPFLIVTLQSLIKFWLFGHWPRKFARWLIGSTKKVISIYTFWVIVLLLRWFMNHKTTVQSFTCWFSFWESRARGHRAISPFGHWPRKFARWLIGSTKKVISIYTFWVIVLLLRWFMNHKTTVQSFTCWFHFW